MQKIILVFLISLLIVSCSATRSVQNNFCSVYVPHRLTEREIDNLEFSTLSWWVSLEENFKERCK